MPFNTGLPLCENDRNCFRWIRIHGLRTFSHRFSMQQIADGDSRIFGVMIESHLKAGRQDLMPGKELIYGLSITDACVGWEDSRKLVEDLADAVRPRRLKAAVEGEAE